jgi:hypothetical protein
MRVILFLLVCLVAGTMAEESAGEEVCEAPGLWGALLEDWATATDDHSGRQGD